MAQTMSMGFLKVSEVGHCHSNHTLQLAHNFAQAFTYSHSFSESDKK